VGKHDRQGEMKRFVARHSPPVATVVCGHRGNGFGHIPSPQLSIHRAPPLPVFEMEGAQVTVQPPHADTSTARPRSSRRSPDCPDSAVARWAKMRAVSAGRTRTPTDVGGPDLSGSGMRNRPCGIRADTRGTPRTRTERVKSQLHTTSRPNAPQRPWVGLSCSLVPPRKLARDVPGKGGT
jgi:hypothetical protein